MTERISDDAMAVLQHALGLDSSWRIPRFSSRRNHFVTGEGSRDHIACMQLVEQDLMERHAGSVLTGGDDLFLVTERGQQVACEMAQKVPTPPRLTRSQKRYQAFLDHDSGVPFGEWLKHYGSSMS